MYPPNNKFDFFFISDIRNNFSFFPAPQIPNSPCNSILASEDEEVVVVK